MQGPGAGTASGKEGRTLGVRPSLAGRLSGAAIAALLLSSCVYWTPRSQAPTASAAVIENVPVQKWDIKSCGAGALSSVLRHHGDALSMEEWDAKLPKTRGGVMSIDLVLAARQAGFDASLVTGDRGTIEAELRDGRPVILMLKVIQAPGRGYDFFHYVVLDGFDSTQNLLRTQFGDGRARWAPLKRLEPAWKQAGYATILIRPRDPHGDALRAAVHLEEEGKLALAADAYREIVRQDPAAALAWTNLGNVEMRRDRPAAAEEAFRKSLELDPDQPDTLNNLAWLLFEEKRLDEAEPLARKAVLTPAPDRWTRLDTLGRILTARGNCAEAAAAFREALADLPESRGEERGAIENAARAGCR